MKKKILILPFLLLVIYLTSQFLTTKSIKIDKIYVINLDRSKERYTHIKNTLDKLDLPVEYTRMSAFDGRNVELVQQGTGERIKGSEFASNTKHLKGDFNIHCSKEWTGNLEVAKLNLSKFNKRTAGELGCACSHNKIYHEIVENGYQNTLIFEDDVFLSPYFDKYLSVALRFAPKDFDILYLGVIADDWHYNARTRNKSLNKITNIFNTIFRNMFFKKIKRSPATSAAYILTEEGAKKIINNSIENKYYYKDNESPISSDGTIGTLVTQKKLRAYVIKPLIAWQNWDKIDSDISKIQNTKTFKK